MKKLLFVLSLSLVLASCGKVKNIPEEDSSKWKSYGTYFKGFRFKYKFPGMDGKANYRWHNASVSEMEFGDEKYIHFFFAIYDTYRDINHFDIMITIDKYEDTEPEKPFDYETSLRKYVDMLKKDIPIDEKLYTKEITINNCKYIYHHIEGLGGKNKDYVDSYTAPLTKEYYVGISARYYQLGEEQFDNTWLASRRKIFDEFVKNVEIIRPEKDSSKIGASMAK
jgi:hypothetical protein